MKRYACVLLSVATIFIIGAVTFSMVLDPYRILHPLLGEFSFEPNSRVPKLKYLMHSCGQYNAYFLGDSRSATLSGRDLPDVAGLHIYNFSTPADNILSIVPRLRFLIDQGCPVSAVIVDESLDVLLENDQIDHYSLLLRDHPRISGENWVSFYSRYFLSLQSLQTYFEATRKSPATHDIYFPDGHADYLWALQDDSSFSLPRCGAPTLTDAQRGLMMLKLSGYRALAQLSAHYHFNTAVWIAPLNRSETPFLQNPDVVHFLRELHAIPHLGVVEPDWQSPLLADFHEWHDCGHFRRSLFDQLIAPSATILLAGVKP
jgi:hypothetical protein